MKHFLSTKDRDDLKVRHRTERDKRVCDRIKAVLLSDEGWDYKTIAHVLLLSDEAIKQHIAEYQASQKLSTENGGSSERLNEEQSKELSQHLQLHTYLYIKDIVAYVESRFRVSYSIAGMNNWLHAHRFSYKKPAVVPGKANQEAQKHWIDKYYALKETLPSDEAICFMDGVHPTHNVKSAYGWIQTGERKELRTNTGRQRLNLSGAIDITSKRVIVREDETLNAASTIAFFMQIEAAYPQTRKVHVFCDNARYYRNKDVQAYITTSKIEMHFLPPYSPNLNPIERLWKFVNENVLYNKYYEKFSSFKEAVLGFLEDLFSPPPKTKELLERRITDNFRIVCAISI